MNKIVLFGVLFLCCAFSASAFTFYGHNTQFADDAESGTNATNANWTFLSGTSPTYDTTYAVSPTHSTKWAALAGKIYYNFSTIEPGANYNVSMYVNITSGFSSGSWVYGQVNAPALSCIQFGIRSVGSTTVFSSYDGAGSWTNAAVNVGFNLWQYHELRVYGTNYEWYVDNQSLRNGTLTECSSAQLGKVWEFQQNPANVVIWVDDFHIWNGTAGGAPAVNDSLTYTGAARNASKPGASVNFSITLASANSQNLTSCTFAIDNGTGNLQNISTTSLSGQSANCNVVTKINTTLGSTIRYQWVFNSTNATTALTNRTSVYTFTTAYTANGTLDYTKYVGNPVGNYTGATPCNYPTVSFGETTGFIEGPNAYLITHFQNSTSDAFCAFNTTSLFNLSNGTRINNLAGGDYEQLVKTTNDTPYIGGALWMTYVPTLDGDRQGPIHMMKSTNYGRNWTDACAGTAVISRPTVHTYNSACTYNNQRGANGTWTCLYQYWNGAAYVNNWTNSTNGCTFTEQGRVAPASLGDQVLLETNTSGTDTFTIYGAVVNGTATVQQWFNTTNLASPTLINNNVFFTAGTQAWEKSPVSNTDPEIIIVPANSQQYWPYQFYLLYLGDQNNTGIAYDTDNRSFYAAHGLVPPTSSTSAAPYYSLLDPSSTGFNSQNRSDNYDSLLNGLYANGNVTQTINGKLWVPWMDSSTSCGLSNIKSGSSCNSGDSIDFTHNCMVSDEFSQVGILVSMGNNATRMDQYYQTLLVTNSSRGSLQSWKSYRNGTVITACLAGVNGNCDVASDADARNIIALLNAANNTAFTDTNRTLYKNLAVTMGADFLQYEMVQSCLPSHLGYGNVCYWLAGGAVVKSSGMTASYFTYTGYGPDAQQAMALLYSMTGNKTYAAVAGNLSIGYLQAAYPNNYNWSSSGFRVPPGKAFHWTNTSTDPAPVCDDTCSPVQWDSMDASRALGYCEANYWMRLVGLNNTAQETYCKNLGNMHMNNTNSAPIQFYPNGTNSAAYQSGFLAQGLEALHQMGGSDQTLFNDTIDNALGHYSSATQTWDSTACFGVYQEAFSIRALGEGIGRNYASWSANVTPSGNVTPPLFAVQVVAFYQSPVRSNDDAICQANVTNAGASTVTYAYNITGNGTTLTNGNTVGNSTGTTNVSILDHALIHRGDNLICYVSADDGTATSTVANATTTVQNALPVLLSAIINTTGTTLNCNYTYTDNDNDTIQSIYHTWFTGGSQNMTNVTFNAANLTNGTPVICSIIIYDGYDNSTPLNTSAYYAGDSYAPNITNITIPSTGQITDVLVITATVNDDHDLIQNPVISFIDPNGLIQGNYTMTNSSPSQFSYSHTYNTVGTYTNFTITSQDASGNIGQNKSSSTLTISAGGGGGGGGGGGNSVTIITTNSTYSFESPVIDQGLLIMNSFTEDPVQFAVNVRTSKPTTSCKASTPFTCQVIENGSAVQILYTEPSHDFFGKTIKGSIQATSTGSELAQTTATFRIINVGYALGKETSRPADDFFTTFPYFLRVKDGNIAGVRLIALIGTGFIILLIIVIVAVVSKK